jgi:hypothetical protein
VFTFGMYLPPVAKGKDGDPLERWRHFERRYAELVAPLLDDGSTPLIDKDTMVELASTRAKADRWRDRLFKAMEGVRD